jgi:hypothetical protein
MTPMPEAEVNLIILNGSFGEKSLFSTYKKAAF